MSIRKQDRPETAFITKSGCFEFNYLPFGLKSVPVSFMRFIQEVLYSQDLELHENTEICLDDILIHAKDKSTHNCSRRMCKYLNKFNLGINLSKCVLAKPSLITWVLQLLLMAIGLQTKKSKQFVTTPCQKQFGN